MIEQEDFDKLKQSDRIELLLRENRLEEKKDNSYFDWGTLNWFFLAVVGFLMIYSNQYLILGMKEQAFQLLKIGKYLIFVAICFTFYGIISNSLFKKYLFPKWDKKLESHFFKREIKNKK